MNWNCLWAPWRMEFIQNSDKDGGCFLCSASESSDDRARFVVHRAEHAICLMNRYPYNNGHLLIAPLRHEGAMECLSEAEVADMFGLLIGAKKALDAACKPHGYNVGANLGKAAGAGLEKHFHLHIVPRWQGDTNFAATIGETKVIPQALEETWELLRKHWA